MKSKIEKKEILVLGDLVDHGGFAAMTSERSSDHPGGARMTCGLCPHHGGKAAMTSELRSDHPFTIMLEKLAYTNASRLIYNFIMIALVKEIDLKESTHLHIIKQDNLEKHISDEHVFYIDLYDKNMILNIYNMPKSRTLSNKFVWTIAPTKEPTIILSKDVHMVNKNEAHLRAKKLIPLL
jgi:hypothetical protein